MGLLNNLFGMFVKQEQPRTLKKENFKVVGIPYYEHNLKKLAVSNNDWKQNSKTLIAGGKINKEIYRYNYVNRPVKLVPEPQNKHDRNAIQVIIAGEHVGYISSTDNLHVKDIITNHEIKYLTAYIHGGQYKIISPNGEMFKDELNLSINLKIGYV